MGGGKGGAPIDAAQPKRNAIQPDVPRAPTVHDLLIHHRQSLCGEIDRDHPFSWARCIVSMFSYALLLSDVLRTGLGFRDLSDHAPYEPDTILYFGPYAYPVVHFTTANATANDTVQYWLYKYDTTSIGMRSLAKMWRLDTVPPCVKYKITCDEASGIPRSTIFTMLDSIIDSVANHRPLDPRGPRRGGHLTLRAEVKWYDRLHHRVLPWIFQRNLRRGIQAIHIDDARLRDPSHRICGPQRPRPFACTEFWTVFTPQCLPSSSEYYLCHHVTDIWTHMTQRTRELLDVYANYTAEMVVIESIDDFTRSSLVHQGRRLVDVVALMRFRDCTTRPCRTIAVDDYRYEGGVFTTNVTSWFSVVATIRVVGQLYAWARLAMLFAGAYHARFSRHTNTSVWHRSIGTIKTAFLIPSQVIIYGSIFPISCYVLAHLIDSATVYEFVSRKFRSPLGAYKFDIVEVIKVCAVSMRSVWVAASFCHVILAVYTHRSWSSIHGVPGVPEFAISFIASLTVFAQVRALSWRNTDIIQVQEVASSLTMSRMRTLTYDTVHGALNQLLLGTTLDVQCLSTSLLLLSSVMGFVWAFNRMLPTLVKHRMTLLTTTPVPYCAGHVWTTNSLVVSWFDSASPSDTSNNRKPSLALLKPGIGHEYRSMFVRAPARGQLMVSARIHSALLNLGTSVSHPFQQYMVNVHHCPPQVESMIFLLNLAIMTDPIIYCQLRVWEGSSFALYESRVTKRCFLLPHALVGSGTDLPINWSELKLLLVVNTKDLNWRDLLHCG